MARPNERHRDRASVAYLCSAYPAVSHTFVLREVQALRRLGMDIETFSVRRVPTEAHLSDVDRSEAARTQHLLPSSASALIRALLALLRVRRGPAALVSAGRATWAMRRPGLRGCFWQLFYLAEALLFWAECERRSIGHVHAHFANVASEVAFLTAVIERVIEPEDPLTWSFTMHGPADFPTAERDRLGRKLESARFVVCISDFSRSQLMALTEPHLWDRIHVVHCGLDLDRYRWLGSGASPTGADGTPRIVAVGRLVSVKGQLLVVDAVERLRSRGLDVSAEIIGEGPMRGDLERAIAAHGLEDRVTLVGALGQDEVPARVRGATVFLLPSFVEGVPVVAMEAMALGVPVVASRIAGVPELIQDGVSGLLTTPARLNEIVDALERLLVDPQLRENIAAAALTTIQLHFDIDKEAGKLARLFPHPYRPVSLRSVSDSPQTLLPL